MEDYRGVCNMRKKNGFISMSIIYSFFTVFILVSTSLLLIYSNNLSIVKTINKDIKDELNIKGNKSLMIFKNLIVVGSFEKVSDTLMYKEEMNTPVYDEQRYYGNYSLGMVKNVNDKNAVNNKTLVQSKNDIHMIKNHYYYISRVYLAYNNILPTYISLNLIPKTNADFSETGAFDILNNAYGIMAISGDSCGNTTTNLDCLFGNRSIRRERVRYQSGFCLGVNGRCSPNETSADASQTQANTFESGIFKFTASEGDYKLLIGADFTVYDEGLLLGILPRYYTDGYMLIDLNVALQLDAERENKFFNNESLLEERCRIGAGKIDELLDGRFIENQKTIPINKLELD